MSHSSSRVPARALTALGAALVATALVTSACSSGDGGSADGASGSSDTTSSAQEGPGDAAAPTTPSPNRGPAHAVQTPNGPVTVPASAKRVVVLGYRLTGLAFDLGAPVKATVPEQPGMASEPAQAWRDAAGVQGTAFLPWTPEGFDVDAIRAMNPDLIIGGGPGLEYRHVSDAYEDLSAIAPTVVIDENEDTWQEQLATMADALNATPRLTKLMRNYDGMVDRIHESTEPPTGTVGYLVLDANEQPYALNETVGLPRELEKVGFRPSPATTIPGLTPAGNDGEVLPVPRDRVSEVFDQDTLFVLGLGRNIVNPGELARDPRYADLPAIKNFRAFGLDYTAVDPGYDETMGALGLMGNLFPTR